MKVAIYSGEIPSTSFIERLIKALSEEGIKVLLFGTITRPFSYQQRNIKLVPNYRGLGGLLVTIVRCVRLRIARPDHYSRLRTHLKSGPLANLRAFRRWQKFVPPVLYLPDVFHVQWAKAAGDWCFLKELFGVKLVLSLRGAHINYSPLANKELAEMYGQVLPKYDAYHAVSRAIVERARVFGVDPKRTVTVYSGINVSQTPLISRASNGKAIKLLAVGRMHWKKGYHHLLDTLAILKERQVDVTLTLVAKGNMPEELLYQLHDLRISNLIRWIEGLSYEDVLLKMKEHDVLVLPSVEEGIANVVLEAMSVGLPVISTNCGGMNEVIQDGRNGFLVPVRNVDAMAEAVIRYSRLSMPEIESLRTCAYETIRQKFSMKENVKAFIRLYEEA